MLAISVLWYGLLLAEAGVDPAHDRESLQDHEYSHNLTEGIQSYINEIAVLHNPSLLVNRWRASGSGLSQIATGCYGRA